MDYHPKRKIKRIQPESYQGEETCVKNEKLRSIAICVLVFATSLGATAMTNILQDPQPFPSPKNEPPIVTPGKTDHEPPSDAIVLFDGKDLSKWKNTKDGGDAKWSIQNGFAQVVPRTGDIVTKDQFGDCQL